MEAKKSIHITSNEESDDAIKLNSLLGGIDMDTKKSIHITSNEASDDAIKINSKLGGIDDANSSRDITVQGGHNTFVKHDVASAINLTSNAGTSETM